MAIHTEQLIRVSEVAEILSVSKATIWNWLHSKPDFPKPEKLSNQITVWKLSDINNYIDTHVFSA